MSLHLGQSTVSDKIRAPLFHGDSAIVSQQTNSQQSRDKRQETSSAKTLNRLSAFSIDFLYTDA